MFNLVTRMATLARGGAAGLRARFTPPGQRL